MSTFADTAGAAFDTTTAGFFAAGLFAAGFFAAGLFAAVAFAALLTAAFAPVTVTALPGALTASFLTAAGKTPTALVADLVTLVALPALPAVLRDFVETAMVTPESGQQCDHYPASVIASCISRFGLSNRIGAFAMYIVAIAWLYVVVLMALTETSFIAGLVTLVFYGIAPLALFLWLMGTPERRRRQRSRQQPDE